MAVLILLWNTHKIHVCETFYKADGLTHTSVMVESWDVAELNYLEVFYPPNSLYVGTNIHPCDC